MASQSVDALQKTLAETVFSYAADSKKASGRALGTLVEIITYYTLRAWELRDHIAIERPLPEFGNLDIRHNVEFSLHPIAWKEVVPLDDIKLLARPLVNSGPWSPPARQPMSCFRRTGF